MSDNVNHPDHYCQGGVECIEALKSATVNKSPFEAICVSNVIKYLWRYEEKGGLEDVMKAAWYLKRLMMEIEEKETKYRLVATENGAALQTPWKTLLVPKEGDMFNPKDEAREHLHELSSFLRKSVEELGFNCGKSETMIIPVIIGSEVDALKFSRALYERGFLALAVRPPTVPAGTSRLRISLNAAHTKQDVMSFLSALESIKKEL